jgi:septal ring factor EnvC (AmiA/AmiB activator)
VDIDRKIEEQQQTLSNVNDELKKLDTVIESIGKHLGDMS